MLTEVSPAGNSGGCLNTHFTLAMPYNHTPTKDTHLEGDRTPPHCGSSPSP